MQGPVSLKLVFSIAQIAEGLISILTGVPLVLRRIKKNDTYGFRIAKAFESEENWYRINEYGGRLLIWWSVAIMAIWGVIALLPISDSVAIALFLITQLSIFWPLLKTLAFAKKL